MAGALAAAVARREALVAQQRCGILATPARDDTPLAPEALLTGDTGQQPAARGCRFLTDPQCLAASLARKPPKRIMAWLMVMTVCLFVDAALESRIRQALRDHEATFPHHQGHAVQHPTARWGLP